MRVDAWKSVRKQKAMLFHFNLNKFFDVIYFYTAQKK